MDDDPLRKAIWTHAGAYKAHPQTDLVAAADINPEALASFGRRWGVDHLYTDVSEMLENESVDILSICTWSNTHLPYVVMGSDAGVDAIWCEKPMALNLAETDQMLETCHDLVLAVNHVRRWDDCYTRVHKLLEQGAVGKIQGAVAAYSGGIANIGTHLFDTLNYLLGEPRMAWAHETGDSDLLDPSPSGDIEFQDGVICHIIGCESRAYLVFEIDILGTEGRLKIMNNGHRAEMWTVADSPHLSGYRELEFKTLVHDGGEGQRMVSAVSDLINCIENGGQPNCSGKDGRAALELTAAFLKSSGSGRRVTLPMKGRDLKHTVAVR